MGIAEPAESGGAHVLRRDGLLSVTGLGEGVCAPMGRGSGPTQPAVWISGAPNVLKDVKQAGRGGEDLSLEAPPDSPGLQSRKGRAEPAHRRRGAARGGVGGKDPNQTGTSGSQAHKWSQASEVFQTRGRYWLQSKNTANCKLHHTHWTKYI